jgi:hypothetical protein
VGRALGPFPAQLGGKVLDDILKNCMSVPGLEQIKQVLA